MGDNPSAKTGLLNNIRSETRASRRRHSRVAVGPKDRVSAVLKEKTYPVADMSAGGIRIQCPETSDLTPDQVVDDCELRLPKGPVKRLTGKMVHSSGKDGPMQDIGIQWINLQENALKKIAAHVSKVKQALNQTVQDHSA